MELNPSLELNLSKELNRNYVCIAEYLPTNKFYCVVADAYYCY